MKKQSILFLLLIAVIGIVGVTVAYFSSRATFENEFETPEYGTTYIEKFVSPDNWLPGDETEKTLEVKNSGSVDEAVRVKVEESWVSKKGTTLSLTQGDNVAALINFINNDDWTKVTVDGEDYYYYYYNYRLAPGETTSKLLDKVTFNPLINASTTCSDTVVDGVTIRVCNSNKEGYDGATYTLTLTIETVQYNKYKEAWGTGNTITLLDEKPEPSPTGVEYLAESATNPNTITSYNDESSDKGKMFTFSHTLNAGTENEKTVTETRYIGNVPKNYVYFNCDSLDNQNEETCEVWRIIGVFDVEREIDDEENPGQKKTITEQRMKLVRGNSLATRMIWNTGSQNTDWTTATLNKFLNGDYYNGTVMDGLKISAQGMIDKATYYLGSVSYDSTTFYGNTEKIYGEERGTVLCRTCNGDVSKLKWQGYIGLMYPSDQFMVYSEGVNDQCYISPSKCSSNAVTGWIFNSNIKPGDGLYYTWFLSSKAGSSNIVLHTGSTGILHDYVSVDGGAIGVRPVVYLSSDVQIIGGDGSSESPYKLKNPQ
ncbi:MAG: hypothetical protein IJR82_00050 [Bacilli bacterium]|nr:hypothetical protein [Bacilli bacterium]